MEQLFPFVAQGKDGPQVLGMDGERVLYRGRREKIDGGDGSVLVVLPTADRPSPSSLDRLAHEYELRDALDGGWAARPLALVRQSGRTALLLEDPGGEPLERLIGAPMEAGGFLRLAIGVVAALGEAHQRGLVHKDVKPANVLVNCADGQTRLTGFGIASRLPRERQAPEPPEVIVGTLAYMAPEQTGRMNRSIDSRSDLYALGVTFYQMLTGSLPFSATDPMEWVHCHIARKPIAPAERQEGVPAVVSDIVMKLLAKTAEERYQTAAGLERDLRRCLAERERHGRIEAFALAENDLPDRLMIPEKLYGREREVEALLAAFDRVVAGAAPELVLVSGYSGVGKSSVVNELHKALVPPRGLFASGKFDQYKRDIPYATLAQAFQSLVRRILGQSGAELDYWRSALREALGANAGLMVNLVPELELVIGRQPSVPDLPPQDAKNRFQMVFRRFLGVFARPEHPLALFLDDLQWLDTATLDLLEHLVTQSEVRRLLLVGAYRDNEVGPAHPLLRTLEAIRGVGARVQEIVLTPLGHDDVRRLVADGLHCEPELARPLAHLVEQKTEGNPFFAIQFLTALADDGLLAFDPVAPAWRWDIDRIRAKGYTDNVVDLMVGKLKRLPTATQEALKQLACLGNVVEVGTLALVHGETEQATRTALWEAVHAGLVFPEDGSYKFLHDRIQQAAYSLIPEGQRPEIHRRIGRMLLESLTAEQLIERLFDVANQLNRGAARLIDRDERVQAATIDLRAGRKSKASAAYASARAYFAAGMALLDDGDWGDQYQLTFSLWLECAECELLIGDFEKSQQLILELLRRAASKVDHAAVYNISIQLNTMKGDYPQAVDKALTCLRLFGIDLPAHPSREEVQTEYETVWRNLNGRSIERLIDLARMTDPEILAVMQVLSVLAGPATFTDFQLFCMLACRMVNVSIQHGMSGASAYAYACLGSILGVAFHRYQEGYRLGRLACDLVAKHGFAAYHTKVSHAMGLAAFWKQPITSVIELRRATTRTATEAGDLTFACYGMHQTITGLLVRNDPLDVVWRESETALDFARKAKFRDVVDLIVSQQRFIASMQGRDATFSVSGQRFEEAAFEAQLTATGTPTVACLHWIRKLKARYLLGDHADALLASEKAKALLWISVVQLQMLDYFYYAALTVAAVFETAAKDRQSEWRQLLTLHCEQLREWAENNPETFTDKHALVAGEVARIEGRDADAMRLYELAIQSAREHGFVQNEGVAHEVAARFYAERGIETVAHACLRNARYSYIRWGAEGKVRQLERLHPHLRQPPAEASRAATIGAPAERLDAGAVIKASQAVSGEMLLDRLIETLMRIALEHAGAQRGLLVLMQGETPHVEAEAAAEQDTVVVTVRQEVVTPAAAPESLLRTVIRTKQIVILDDASTESLFSADPYIREKRARSVLCLPLVKQTHLIGVLYLENSLASHVFTPTRISLLELLASQAAISLENARLYGELMMSEERWRKLFESVPVGVGLIGPHRRYVATNPAFQRMTGYSEEELRGLSPADITHEDDRAETEAIVAARIAGDPLIQRIEKRYRRQDGGVIWAEVSGFLASVEGSAPLLGAIAVDVTERKRAEETLSIARAELTHAARLTTLGQLTASIAHEINQPLAAIASHSTAGLNWLNRKEPDLSEARAVLSRIATDSARASDVIRGLRALAKKSGPQFAKVHVDEVIGEVLALAGGELRRNRVVLRTDLASGSRPILGDHVQLQQVMLNLIMNGVEAMSEVTERARELVVSSTLAEPGSVLVSVEDTGVGMDPAVAQRIFEPFFTTKSDGLGMGLSICRSIIEGHHGRMWASPRAPHGAAIHFTIPIGLA